MDEQRRNTDEEARRRARIQRRLASDRYIPPANPGDLGIFQGRLSASESSSEEENGDRTNNNVRHGQQNDQESIPPAPRKGF
jgi:hypothetical protein